MGVSTLSQDGPPARIYERILDAVGARVDDIGRDRLIAAHWPFVGSQYRGLMIAGQALKGWDAETTPARWRLEEATDPAERARLLRGAQRWANAGPEPISEVLRWGHRRRAPFWGFSQRIVPMLEPDLDGPWFSRYCWWNVYPLGWDDFDGSPTGLLKDLQTPLVGELFWAVIAELEVRRVVLVSGKDWWPEVRSMLGLEGLRADVKPVIAAGRVHAVTVVATYHPGAHLLGTTRDAFARLVADAVAAADARG